MSLVTTPSGSTAVDRLVQQQALVYRQMETMVKQAEAESRGFTEDDTKRYKELTDQHAQLEKRIGQVTSDAEQLRALDRLTSGAATRASDARSSAGALFAEATGEFFKHGGHRRSGYWESPAAEVPYSSLFATTVTESPGSGGALVVPQYLPGIVPSPTRPIVVMDLLMPGTTNSNAVVYMSETTFTNAAAPTAENTAKPESALVFAATTEPVLKIAHWLPITEELLEDVPAISAYIDGRLRLGVQLAEDDQLLNGNGTAPNFKGLLLRATAPVITQGTPTAGESVADAILRQIAAITTTAFTAPTGLVMNPSDWVGMQTLKTTTNDYIGPSPFETPVVPTLWGLPVALTPAIAAKTVLVGAFSTMAQFFRRGGIMAAASNSHQDFFVKNLKKNGGTASEGACAN